MGCFTVHFTCGPDHPTCENATHDFRVGRPPWRRLLLCCRYCSAILDGIVLLSCSFVLLRCIALLCCIVLLCCVALVCCNVGIWLETFCTRSRRRAVIQRGAFRLYGLDAFAIIVGAPVRDDPQPAAGVHTLHVVPFNAVADKHHTYMYNFGYVARDA